VLLSNPIGTQLQLFQNWSLTEIRRTFDNAKKAGGPFVDRKNFIYLNKNSPASPCKLAFNMLQQNGKVNIYEVLAAAAIYSWSNSTNKVKFLFHMFDFEERGKLTPSEVTILIMSVSRGIGLLTQTEMPTHAEFS
jgi:Ca2+-binding EF-hand superfamily protein